MLIIVFSYNRSMQLDYFLGMLRLNFRYEPLNIAVLYNCSPEHALSYEHIIDKYAKPTVKFYKEERIKHRLVHIFPAFLHPLNSYRIAKHKKLRNYSTNFKKLTEQIIANSDDELMMFCTDDGCFYNESIVPNRIVEIIKNNPWQCNYKMYIGKNCKDYENCSVEKSDFMYWNYYDKQNKGHWGHPFAVDCTVFSRKVVLKIIRKIWYTNPNTLEGMVNGYVKRKKYFKFGYSPVISNYYCIPLNMVQNVSNNYAGTTDPGFLMEKYLEGFRIVNTTVETINSKYYYPRKLVLKKKDQTIEIDTNF